MLKFADAKRILFLVDTRNLGEQAEQEMMSYLPNDDNRKFTELYTVQSLNSSYVSKDTIAVWMQQADRNGQLSKFLNPNLTPPELGIAGIEGWILGVE